MRARVWTVIGYWAIDNGIWMEERRAPTPHLAAGLCPIGVCVVAVTEGRHANGLGNINVVPARTVRASAEKPEGNIEDDERRAGA